MASEESLTGLNRGMKTNTPLIYTVDSFANGISFGQHKGENVSDTRSLFSLRIGDDAEVLRLRSRYAIHKQNPLHELEKHLIRLSKQGLLRSSHIYFGVTTDPFFPFDGKFDASFKFLELFQKYTPGLLTIQTRSPLIVIALPVLKRLGTHAAVTIPIETPHDEVVRRYTPGFPRIEERLKTATALRRFGIPVTLQASPVLPYGDWRNDARFFAELLVNNSDHIHVQALTDGSEKTERRVRGMELSKKLAQDRKFHYMRPDAAQPLYDAIEALAPEKLREPSRNKITDRQLKIFAA